MTNPEKDLQDLLKALEEGRDLDSVLRGMPDGTQELTPLLKIVSHIQQLPHPEPSPAKAAQQQQKMMAVARETFHPRRAGWKWPKQGWMITSSLAGALALVVVFIVLAAAASYAAITLNTWTTVEVVEAIGVVQVASPDQPESWQTIQSGERMREGERIRSSADGTATLRFPNGSLVVLGPSTDVSLIKVERGWNGRQEVVLIQHAGDTLHEVVPLITRNSQYQLHTPSGTASVKGTSFGVTVDLTSGKALYSVNEGSVWVEAAGENVVLETGQATFTQPDMAPEEPAYSFQIKGILSAWDESVLVIGNIQLNVSENMLVQGKPAIGEMARVAGHIDETGVWWADLLSSSGGKFQAKFTGILEAKGETVWQVSGTSLLIDANTKLSGIMEIGDPVKVDFVVLEDGQFLATHIRPLDEDEEPTPTVTSTPTVTATPPDITPTPTATATITPTPTITTTGTPPTTDTTCTGADPHPTGMTLAERYGVTYEEIMGWFCSGYGFGEIDLAYGWSVEYGIPVTEIFAMREAGEGWGNIKKYLEENVITPTPKPTKEKKPTHTPKPEKDK